MSCGSGSCGCGSSCKCSSGCNGRKMYADFSKEAPITSVTTILGVAPQKGAIEGFEIITEGVENGCNCGSSCTCNPCSCK